MAKATRQDLLRAASSRIENNDALIYDVAAEYRQHVENVKHMQCFRNAVANELIDSTKKYAHLEYVE